MSIYNLNSFVAPKLLLADVIARVETKLQEEKTSNITWNDQNPTGGQSGKV